MWYRIKRIFKIDYKRMFSVLMKICEASGRSMLVILPDVVHCGLKFGAGYMDYFVFRFWEINDEQRSTYINRTDNNGYLRTCNNREYYYIFNHKPTFLQYFAPYIRRDYVDLDKCTYEEYEAFCRKHEDFMAKPSDGLCGYGIDAINCKDKDLKELYDSFKQKGQCLLEERIVQNEQMNQLYPCAINTIRVVTHIKDDKVTIMFVALRMGNEGRHVDNFNSGGIFTVVDNDGSIKYPGINKEGKEYELHPYTSTSIVGFKIPRFSEILDLCREMARVVPQNGLTGWDICVTDKGIDVVEGNQLPGYDIYQSKCHLSKERIGLKPFFDEVIYGKENKYPQYNKDYH